MVYPKFPYLKPVSQTAQAPALQLSTRSLYRHVQAASIGFWYLHERNEPARVWVEYYPNQTDTSMGEPERAAFSGDSIITPGKRHTVQVAGPDLIGIWCLVGELSGGQRISHCARTMVHVHSVTRERRDTVAGELAGTWELIAESGYTIPMPSWVPVKYRTRWFPNTGNGSFALRFTGDTAVAVRGGIADSVPMYTLRDDGIYSVNPANQFDFLVAGSVLQVIGTNTFPSTSAQFYARPHVADSIRALQEWNEPMR